MNGMDDVEQNVFSLLQSHIDLTHVKIGEDVTIYTPCNIYGRVVIGNHVRIGPFVEIQDNVEIGSYVKIGSHSFICSGTRVGSRVFIGHGVMTCNDIFPEPVVYKIRDTPLKGKSDWMCTPPILGNDVIIGSGAVILPGVIIGDWGVVGAGAVVTKDVKAGTVVFGVPARYLRGRWRTEEEEEKDSK